MNKEQYITAVKVALIADAHPMVNPIVETEAPGFAEFVGRMHHFNWSFEDAVAYMQLSEEFNPTLKEEYALAAMHAITRKYLGGPMD